jgi:hypothetical protein
MAARHLRHWILMSLACVLLHSPEAFAIPPQPGTPTVSAQPTDGGGVVVTIEWTYDVLALTLFPDTVFTLGGVAEGSTELPSEFWRRSAREAGQGGGDFTRQDNRFRLILFYPRRTFIARVAVVAENADGRSVPSDLSNPVSLDPSNGAPPPEAPPPDPPQPPDPTGPPTTPVLNRPGVNGRTVTLTWTYNGPPITEFEILAFTESGQEVRIRKPGNVFTHVQSGVPDGRFVLSIRALGVGTASPLSDPVVVVVGAGDDLRVTLTWDSVANMQLNVMDPNGVRIYQANHTPTDSTAFMEGGALSCCDDDGFGPEIIRVPAGRSVVGNYLIWIEQHLAVDTRPSIPTNSRIQVTVNEGTPNERTMVFMRFSSTISNQRIMVAVADPVAGTIQPRNLLGEAFVEGESHEEVKTP